MNKKKIIPTDSVSKRIIGKIYGALFYSKEISGVSSKRAHSFLGARFFKRIGSISRSVSYTSTRTYGAMFMTFGILSLILNLARYYFDIGESVSLRALVIAASLAVIAIPLVVKDIPISEALQEFAVTDFIFFEFFAIKRTAYEKNVKAMPPLVGAIVGVIPALLVIYFPIEAIVAVIAAVFFVAVSFVSPEFPILFSIIILPYLGVIPMSMQFLAGISIIAFVSFFRKVLVGKRVYSFESCDILLLIFAVAIVIGGSIGSTGESVKNLWILVALILGYFPASNIIVNRRLADCTVNAIIVSVVPVAIGAVAEYVKNILRGERVASRSVTASPETLAAFLLVAAVLVLPFAIRSRKRFYKVIYSAAFVLSILAILATECIPVLFAAVVILLVYLIRRNRRIPAEIALIVSFLPCLVLFLPNSLLDAVSRALSTSFSLSEIKQALISGFSLFSENVFAGAGAEELSSIGGAVPHIILGIGYRFGIFALLAFLLFLFARFRQLSVFTSYLSSSSLKDLVELSAVAVLSVLAFGSFHDVLLDPSIFYLFFIVFAVYAAALRISRFDYEDLLAYYGDQRSHHSSVIDVAIRA